MVSPAYEATNAGLPKTMTYAGPTWNAAGLGPTGRSGAAGRPLAVSPVIVDP